MKSAFSGSKGLTAWIPAFALLHSVFAAAPNVVKLEYRNSLAVPTGDSIYAWTDANLYRFPDAAPGEPRFAVNWLRDTSVAEYSYRSKVYFYGANLAPMGSFRTYKVPPTGEFQALADYEMQMNLAGADMDDDGKMEILSISRTRDHGVYAMQWDQAAGKIKQLRRDSGIPVDGSSYQRGLAIGEFSGANAGKEFAYGNSYGLIYLRDKANNPLAEFDCRQFSGLGAKTIQNILPLDLDGDGGQELVVSAGRNPGRVFALKYAPASRSLQVLWNTNVTPTGESGDNCYQVAYLPNGSPTGGPALAGSTEQETHGIHEGSVFLMDLGGNILWQREFPLDGGRAAGCGFADVTGDGRPEIITRAVDEGHSDVIIYDNTGEILGRTRVGFTIEGFGPYFNDFDGDGKEEMAVFGQEGRKAVVRFYDISLVPASNLALKRLPPSTLTASSSDPGSPVANLADGNPGTYWASSSNAYPAWIQVDLGAVCSVRKTVARFYEEGDGRYYGYRIEASEDGVQYATLTDNSANTVIGRVADAFDGVYARYIRLNLINCNRAGGWPSLFEFEVWGQRNLALGRSIVASGYEVGKPPERAVDGSHTTDWASEVNQFPQWIKVDLGGGKAISGARTDFYQEGDGRYYRYRVESSQDNANFSLIANKNSNTTVGKVEDTFKDVYGRQVRIDLDGCSRPWGGGCWPSLNEMEVFGTSNLAVGRAPVAYSGQQAGNEADRAVDGDTTTRWSAENFPQWIQVDLGVIRSVGRMEVLPRNGRAYRYEILGSTDGTTFSRIVDRTANNQGGAILADTFAPVRARYVRLKVTGCYGDPTSWASVNELRIFGD